MMLERLFAAGVSHRTVPLALLERLALSGSRRTRFLRELASNHTIREAVALSTCNRTELYLVAADSSEAERLAASMLSREAGVPTRALRLHPLWAADAARHLFRVAAGLESMVAGEAEIQGQVRRAYKHALLEGTAGPITGQLFRAALEAGKRVRFDPASSGSCASVASVAVELARRQLGDLERRRALVIGSGENAALTGRALAGRGARTVFVAHRRLERARTLARRLGARAVGFESLHEELVYADVAFSCTASRSPIVTVDELAAVMEHRDVRPLLLIDIGVPRNMDPAVGNLSGVAVYDIDRLKREVAHEVTLSVAESDSAERLIDHEVGRFTDWLASRDVAPEISALREHADNIVKGVLDEHEPFFESLSEVDRERISTVAQTVVKRLLHDPTTRLRRIPANGEPNSHAQALLELFGLYPTTPAARQPQELTAPRRAGPTAQTG